MDDGDGGKVLPVDETLLMAWRERMGLMLEDDGVVFHSSLREREMRLMEMKMKLRMRE